MVAVFIPTMYAGTWPQRICFIPMAIGFAIFCIYGMMKFDRWFYKQLK
jgi:hypothetical protein